MTTLSDDELYNLLRKDPDFECFPLPTSWYKKYGIEPVKAMNPREYMESNYIAKLAFREYSGEPIIINEPQQNGKVLPLFPPEDVPVEVTTRPLEEHF
jgi:hypothetical protein